MYKVYKHTTPSNKVYIGITTNKLSRRWQICKKQRKTAGGYHWEYYEAI